jgi:hypothetical protein
MPVPHRPSSGLHAEVYEKDGRSYLVVRDRNGVAEMLCIPGGSEARIGRAVRGDATAIQALRDACSHRHGPPY